MSSVKIEMRAAVRAGIASRKSRLSLGFGPEAPPIVCRPQPKNTIDLAPTIEMAALEMIASAFSGVMAFLAARKSNERASEGKDSGSGSGGGPVRIAFW